MDWLNDLSSVAHSTIETFNTILNLEGHIFADVDFMYP